MRWHLRQKKGNKDNKFRHGLRGLHGFCQMHLLKPCNPRNPCLKKYKLFPLFNRKFPPDIPVYLPAGSPVLCR